MRAPTAIALALLGLTATPVAVAHLDHVLPTTTGTAPPLSTNFNAGGPDAEWELLATIPTLNPHSDVDTFTQGGETYASVGNLGAGPNGGGQVIVRLTKGGKVDGTTPEVVSNHPSAACPQDPSASLGLQHDVEVTPKGNAIFNVDVRDAARQDAQLLLDATDAAGRCHDQGTAGLSSAPRGGIEVVDVTDVTQPKEIVLTTHIGQSHTVNVDPRRPHIAYSVTSDSVNVNAEGVRSNESGTGRALDGWEVLDLRSCLEAPIGTLPPGATVEQKRALCRPEVFRYRYPTAAIVRGHTNTGQIYGCHELEVYPDDRLTCASGSATMLFDVSGAFDDGGTPTDFSDDRPKGTPLPCAVRDTTTTLDAFKTGAKVVDCVVGEGGKDLGIPGWTAIGAPSLEGVEHLGSAFHMGRENATGALQPKFPATQDIDFSHEAELTASRRFIIASDERGGGVTGGAQCTPGQDLEFANGGLHAYAVDRLAKTTPATAQEAFGAYAKTSAGGKAIYRAPVRTEPKGSFCTAHVFQQIPGQNRIFMGWYSQGTQVVDFKENPDGTVDFQEAGWFIPEGANQWVSAVFKVQREADGRYTYFGLTGDGVVGEAGRNGIDVYKVTLPAPPEPAPRADGGPADRSPDETGDGRSGPVGGGAPVTPGKPADTPGRPADTPGRPADAPGARPQGSTTTTASGERCAAAPLFTSATARGAGRGLALAFGRRGTGTVLAEVLQESTGRRTTANRLVARLTGRGSSVRWDGRDRRTGRPVADGAYLVRLTVRSGSTTDVVRLPLRRAGGRFAARPGTFSQRPSCGLVRQAKLSRSVFGGTRSAPLGISFRLGEAAQVTVTVKRGGRLVKRFAARTYDAGRLVRLSVPARGTRAGRHVVTIEAVRGQRKATTVLQADRL